MNPKKKVFLDKIMNEACIPPRAKGRGGETTDESDREDQRTATPDLGFSSLRLYRKEYRSRASRACSRNMLPHSSTRTPARAPPNAFDQPRIPKGRVKDDYSDFTNILAALEYKNCLGDYLKLVHKPSARLSHSMPPECRIRDAYLDFDKKPVAECDLAKLEIAFECNMTEIMKAELKGWKVGRWVGSRRTESGEIVRDHFSAESDQVYHLGWIKANLGFVAGPKRFYILPEGSRLNNFSDMFTEWVDNSTNSASLKPQNTGSVVEYFEPENKYYRAVVLGALSNSNIKLFRSDTGEVVWTSLEKVRALPSEFVDMPSPIVPCRFHKENVSQEEFDLFRSVVISMEKLYVTGIENNVLVVSPTAEMKAGTVEDVFCSNYYCGGKCAVKPYKEERRRKAKESAEKARYIKYYTN